MTTVVAAYLIGLALVLSPVLGAWIIDRVRGRRRQARELADQRIDRLRRVWREHPMEHD
jgi:hypothetical protein